MFLNKKAVSPLIATVLLVMIVVSIGAAVMVVIQGIAQEGIASTEAQNELIKCGTDVSAEIVSVGTSYRVCINRTATNSNNFGVTLENNGIRDIADFRLTMIADTIQTRDNLGIDLAKGVTKAMRFNFNTSGTVVKIILAPKIAGGPSNPQVTCSEPNLEWDQDQIAQMADCNTTAVTWDDQATAK